MINICTVAMSRSGHNFVMDMIGSWNKDFECYSFENYIPATLQYLPEKRSRTRNVLFDMNIKRINLIVVRDLLNWYASYIKLQEEKQPEWCMKDFPITIEKWRQMAMEGFRITNYLEKRLLVIYDQFKESRDYRQFICGLLGGDYSEKYLNKVTTNGRHSSFDGNTFNGRASEMETTKRYKFLTDSVYGKRWLCVLAENTKAVELYKEKFVLNLGQKRLINSFN